MFMSLVDNMGRLDVKCTMKQFHACFDAFFNFIEHKVGTRPIERYPYMKTGVVVSLYLSCDLFSHVERFLRLVDFRVAVAEFCENVAHGIVNLIRFIVARWLCMIHQGLG